MSALLGCFKKMLGIKLLDRSATRKHAPQEHGAYRFNLPAGIERYSIATGTRVSTDKLGTRYSSGYVDTQGIVSLETAKRTHKMQSSTPHAAVMSTCVSEHQKLWKTAVFRPGNQSRS